MRPFLSSGPSIDKRKRMLGRVSLGLLCAAGLVIVVSAAFGFNRMRPESTQQNANTKIAPIPSASDTAASKTADQLREEAMQAYQQGQLFAPAGSNALEIYLSALAQDPKDFGAKEAIFELIPAATQALETAISAGNSAEIERLAQLLLQADPSSTRIVALLERRRAQVNLEQAAGLSATPAVAAVAAAGVTQAEALASASQPIALPVTQASQIAAAAFAQTTSPAKLQAQRTPNMPAPVLASIAASPSQQAIESAVESVAPLGQIVDVRVIKSSPPTFPAEARRRKVTGWVDLKLQIDASGRVTGAAVVGSQPGRIFDAEAKRAVMRWRFSPKTVDSKAVASSVNQRITFNPDS